MGENKKRLNLKEVRFPHISLFYSLYETAFPYSRNGADSRCLNPRSQ
jgi:hypothetical protein